MDYSDSSPRTSTIRWFFRFIERGLLLVTGSIGLGIWVLMLARLLSDFDPIFELATHASFHAFLGCVGLILALGIFYLYRRRSSTSSDRWRRRVFFVVVPMLYFTWVVAPWRFLPLEAATPTGQTLKILSWNVLLVNEQPEDILRLIEREKPDIVALMEVNPELGKRLDGLLEQYPSRLSRAAWNAGGIYMMCRAPEAEFEVLQLGQYWMPAIAMRMRSSSSNDVLSVLAVHTLSPKPMSGERTLIRDRQLQDVAEWAKGQSSPTMVVGDLNISPWSPPFWRLLSTGELADSSSHQGYFPSFPAKLARLGIPIDYALVSDQIQVIRRRNLYESHDSDHCPVLVEIQIQK